MIGRHIINNGIFQVSPIYIFLVEFQRLYNIYVYIINNLYRLRKNHYLIIYFVKFSF